PSASVVLMLRGGRTLDRAQLAGIVHLVASSVPELQTKDVSVLDQTGALLTENSDRNVAGLDATQLQYVTQMEQSYTKRTNQPPVPATAPINGASAPLQAAQGGTVGANGHRETVTNYEVDRTVRVTRNATGLVRHLNAAVVVNQKVNVDSHGKTTSTPLTQ